MSAYDEFDSVEGGFVGAEGIDAKVEAVTEAILTGKTALRWEREGDVAGASVKSNRPPHL